MSVLGEATLGVAHDDDARNMKRRTVSFSTRRRRRRSVDLCSTMTDQTLPSWS